MSTTVLPPLRSLWLKHFIIHTLTSNDIMFLVKLPCQYFLILQPHLLPAQLHQLREFQPVCRVSSLPFPLSSEAKTGYTIIDWICLKHSYSTVLSCFSVSPSPILWHSLMCTFMQDCFLSSVRCEQVAVHFTLTHWQLDDSKLFSVTMLL